MMGLPTREPLFEIQLVGASPGPLPSSPGSPSSRTPQRPTLRRTDIVFVPNVMLSDGNSVHALDPGLSSGSGSSTRPARTSTAHAAARWCWHRLTSSMDSETTTHWGKRQALQDEFPKVRLHPDRILVQTGDAQRIVSCGGSSSWQDLVLPSGRTSCGPEEAVRGSRRSSWYH